MGVHDEEAYLRRSIDSILAQSFEDFEFIVVDDCSTDSSNDIIRGYDDQRIRLVENEENLGLTRSLNEALREARGTYIARQDADDFSHPERLERQVAFMEHHPETALLGTSVHLVDENDRVKHHRRVLRTVTFDDLREKNHVVHGSVLMRRDVLEDVGGYDELYRYAQDYDLWLRIANRHRIRNLTKPLYYFRIHDESIYFSKSRESSLYALLALARAEGTANDAAVDEVRTKGIEAYYDHLSTAQRERFHRQLAETYLRYGYSSEARQEGKAAIRSNPSNPSNYLLYGLGLCGNRTLAFVHEATRRYINVKTRARNVIETRR